ncbi:PHOsphatase, partial [Linnemannia gamsii]
TLLDKYPYDANSYIFASSAKSRSLQSAYGFSVGFFEDRLATDSGSEIEKGVIGQRPPVQPVDISMLPIGLDKELAMKYACPRWLENVKDQPSVVRESTQFQSKFVSDLANRLTAVLSVEAKTPADRFNITVKDIDVLQNLCEFEVAIHNTEKTWCRFLGLGLYYSSSEGVAGGREEEEGERDSVAALTAAKDLFRKFEIAGDLDDYYIHGPGVPFNRHLGCKLATTLMESVEMALTEDRTGSASGVSVSKKDKNPSALGDDDEEVPGVSRAVLKFGHSETLLFFSSFLGLYSQKGALLTGNMTPKQYAEREFRTSKFSQFSANMVFEVYRPIAETSLSSTRKLRRRLDTEATVAGARMDESNIKSAPQGLIRLLVNEEPMVIPGCGSDYFCEWSTFKKFLQRAGTGCDFDGCCISLTKPSPPSVPETEAQASAASSGNRAQMVLKTPQQPACLTVDPIVK